MYGAQRSLISLKLLRLLLGFSSFSLRKSIYFILTVIGYSMHRHVKKFTSIHTLPSPYHLHFTLSAHKSASSKHLKLKAKKKTHEKTWWTLLTDPDKLRINWNRCSLPYPNWCCWNGVRSSFVCVCLTFHCHRKWLWRWNGQTT